MKITNADIEKLIQPTRGNLAQIGRQLGVTRGAIWSRVNKSAKLRKLIDEQREAMIDDAETSLQDQILSGNTTALIFFLKTQAFKRGYTEKQQIEHSGTLNVNLSELPDELLEKLARGEQIDTDSITSTG